MVDFVENDEVRDPLTVAQQWIELGKDVAIATVIETWGSAPRPVGSHLIVDTEGNFYGSVSGGCVESAVIAEAMSVIELGEPSMLEFGIENEVAWQVGLSCGGRIRIFIDRVG